MPHHKHMRYTIPMLPTCTVPTHSFSCHLQVKSYGLLTARALKTETRGFPDRFPSTKAAVAHRKAHTRHGGLGRDRQPEQHDCSSEHLLLLLLTWYTCCCCCSCMRVSSVSCCCCFYVWRASCRTRTCTTRCCSAARSTASPSRSSNASCSRCSRRVGGVIDVEG